MILFILLGFFFQDTLVPFKAKEEFDIKLDLQFRQKPTSSETATKVYLNSGGTERKNQGGKIPYLILHIKVLKLSNEEVKGKIVDASKVVVFHKKLKIGSVIKLDMGFVDEIKDKYRSNEYEFTFLSAARQPVKRIHILIDSQGNYFVNGDKFGKF